jgi:hypothetical protein
VIVQLLANVRAGYCGTFCATAEKAIQQESTRIAQCKVKRIVIRWIVSRPTALVNKKSERRTFFRTDDC